MRLRPVQCPAFTWHARSVTVSRHRPQGGILYVNVKKAIGLPRKPLYLGGSLPIVGSPHSKVKVRTSHVEDSSNLMVPEARSCCVVRSQSPSLQAALNPGKHRACDLLLERVSDSQPVAQLQPLQRPGTTTCAVTWPNRAPQVRVDGFEKWSPSGHKGADKRDVVFDSQLEFILPGSIANNREETVVLEVRIASYRQSIHIEAQSV